MKEKLSRYIFDRKLHMDEVLIVHDDVRCDRIVLWTLISDTWLDSKVITCVAHKQNIVEQTELIEHRKEGPLCYLPANLQDDVMNERLTPAKAFVNYQFTFLSAAAICQEVYLPMCDKNHWYLVVISILEKKVYIADCDDDSEKHEIRRREATSFMLEFISQPFKLVHTNSGLGKKFSPPSDFELSYEILCPKKGKTKLHELAFNYTLRLIYSLYVH
ncbi:hypothetical protein LINGRAHAP2_LOCUS15508 [Linum grandiflorum]